MKTTRGARRRFLLAIGLAGLLVGAGGVLCLLSHEASAAPPWRVWFQRRGGGCGDCDGVPSQDLGGPWYWMRSPDEERRVVIGLYNRYCIRCHGVDGRGIWDIPGVPDFTNVRWQATRSDKDLARIIIEGRGAVMPPFRGALSLEEAYAVGRYLRTFVPGTEAHRPDLTPPLKMPMPRTETPKSK